MDSNEYYNAMESELQEKNRLNQTNYVKKVGSELTIFHSDKKIKEYVESKFFRISDDYEVDSFLKWNTNKSGTVKITNKMEASFPKKDIKEKRKFLTHIPYFLSLYYSKKSKQSLIDINHNSWLDYFSKKFFNISIKPEYELILIEDNLFPTNIIPSIPNYDSKHIKEEKNENGHFFLYKDKETFFYMRFKKRHLLFKIIERKYTN